MRNVKVPRSRSPRERNSPSLNEGRSATLPMRKDLLRMRRGSPVIYAGTGVVTRAPEPPHEARLPPEVAIELAGPPSLEPVGEPPSTSSEVDEPPPLEVVSPPLLGQSSEQVLYASEPPPLQYDGGYNPTAGGSGVDTLSQKIDALMATGDGSLEQVCDNSSDAPLLGDLRICLERVGSIWEHSPRQQDGERMQDKGSNTPPLVNWRQYYDEAVRIELRAEGIKEVVARMMQQVDRAKAKTKRNLAAIRIAEAEAREKLDAVTRAAERVAQSSARLLELQEQERQWEEKEEQRRVIAAAMAQEAAPPPAARNIAMYDVEQPWEDFVNGYEEYAKANGWSPVRKASYLSRYLPEEALSQIYHLSPTAPAAYERMVGELTRRYSYEGKTAASQALLKNRRQGAGESLVRYAAALRDLTDRAYPSVSHALRDEVVWNLFLSGMQDRTIATEVRNLALTTMPEVLAEALAKERIRALKRATSPGARSSGPADDEPTVSTPKRGRVERSSGSVDGLPTAWPRSLSVHDMPRPARSESVRLPTENGQGSGLAIRQPAGPLLEQRQ